MEYFQSYFLDIFKYKYAVFEGRARREEFWYFVLFWILSVIGISFISGIVMRLVGGNIPGVGLGLIGIFILGSILPYLALVSRRLHDTGKSGLWWLIRFIPFGAIVLIVFYCLDSERGPNKWGSSPKYDPSDDDNEMYDRHLIEDEFL